jgi:hypothetical protein
MSRRRILGLALLACFLNFHALLVRESWQCGLPVPHGHILLGNGSHQPDLTAHLAAEATCRLEVPAEAADPAGEPAANNRVLSTLDSDSHQANLLANLPLVAQSASTPAPRAPAGVWMRVAQAEWQADSLELPPPAPPPWSPPVLPD